MILKKNIEVIILAGGLATRIAKDSQDLPKSLMPINGVPFLGYLLKQFSNMGFQNFCLATGHHASALRTYCHSINLNIRFSHEEEPLGTSGAILSAIQTSKYNYFLVINGDTFVKIKSNLSELLKAEKKITICTANTIGNNQYGSIEVNDESQIICFAEKTIESKELYLNAGIYFFEKLMAQHLLSKGSIENDVFPIMANKGLLQAHHLDESFLDIGTYENLNKAPDFFKDLNHF